jgi:RNA polymerase sigma-70 factor, ECF subfamily
VRDLDFGAKSRVQRAREKLKQELLACCHFELDRRGLILDYYPHCDCCEQAPCENTDWKRDTSVMRPFLPNSVSSSKGKREGHKPLLVLDNGKE